MIRPNNDIARVKARIRAMQARRVDVTVRLGRNKVHRFGGTLTGVYPALFTVRPDNENFLGKTAYSMEQPVVKATNAVLVFNNKDSAAMEPTACIHCGRCVENCPLSLNPTAYAKALEIDDEAERYAVLDREKVSLCMECGSCSYVCPARRPLVQNNQKAKSFVRKYKAQLQEKEGGK